MSLYIQYVYRFNICIYICVKCMSILSSSLPRYIGYEYVIYERVLNSLIVSEDFRYQRFTSEDDAMIALSSFGNSVKKYVLIKELSIIA